MFSTNFSVAWQLYGQEKADAQQRFWRWTQGILMIFIITLSQTSQNIQGYLAQNLDNMLGADLVLSQTLPLSQAQRADIADMSEQVVLTQTLTTTLTHADKWQQVSLKGVGEDYPLQGELVVASSAFGQDLATAQGPATGEIWLDTRALSSLSLHMGDVLNLADRSFTLTRVLKHEPDRLMQGHSVAMRAMVNLADMQQLGFPDDLIEHRYLIAGNAEQISHLLDWQKLNLPAAQTYHKLGDHPLALFWQRTENVIGLASIILFFMAAIAIEQLSQRQVKKEQYFCAVCLSLGSSKKSSFQISALKWLLRTLFLLPPVLLISAGCHWLLIHWLSDTFSNLEWQWQTGLALRSALAMSVLFLVFQVPIWLGLRQSSVSQLVHGSGSLTQSWLSKLSAISVLVIVAVAYTDNALLTTMLLSSMAISIALILVLSWLSLTLGEKLSKNLSGLMPFALFMMKQRLVSKSTQILGVGLCAFLLLFTLMLMKDLGQTMAAYQRQHDGNLLVSQASEVQMRDIADWSASHGIGIRQAKPYVYAKLTQVNGTLLSDFSQKPSDSLVTLSRSVRLHWSDKVPSNNRLVEGQWWQTNDPNWQQVSLEQEIMTDLRLDIGDTLTFFIGQHSVDFTISASHVYKPGAGSITFWVQMPPSALSHLQAARYSMASLELTETQFSLLGQLWQRHPSLRMVSLQDLTKRFDQTLAMVTKVISGFSLLIILLAGIVILASIHALESAEKRKNSIVMSFGFSRNTCLQLNMIEWLVTGSIAATGAIVGTYLAGLMIYQSQFSLTYQPNWLWLVATLALILITITGLGIWASRASLSASIRSLLAEQ